MRMMQQGQLISVRGKKKRQTVFLACFQKIRGIYFRELWEEFEAYETADAKYAHLLDNFQPVLLNDASGGKSWAEHGVKKSQIYKRNEKVEATSKSVWEMMQKIVQKNITPGNIKDE